MKKILALVLALALVLVVAVASANTITVQSAVKGETYNIYKMLDLETDDTDTPNKAMTYIINDDWAAFWTGSGAGAAYIDTNTVGDKTYVVWKEGKDTAAEMEAFAKAAAKFASDNSKSPAAAAITAGDGDVTFTVGDGYYLVTSTLGIAATVFSTPANTTQQIKEKNETSSSDKDVKEDSTNTYGKSNDAQVGDTIEFKAKVSIAKNSINVKYHDTMDSQLDWTGAASVNVYTDAGLTSALDAANWSVKTEDIGTETFVVEFTDAYVASLTAATTDLYITYTAVLNDSALITDEIHNTQSITWGDNGKYTGEPTTTKTYKFILNKYDGASEKLLAGAKFQLYTVATDGTPLKLAKNADGTAYRVYSDASKLPEGFTATDDDTIVTIATSTIDIIGVDDDDYYLDETEPPTGYTKLTERFHVKVADTNNIQADVENNSGTTLPSTGGIGTTIFYILGGLLVVGAAVILVARRKAQD